MWRAPVVFSLICAIFILIILRLFYWQILSGDSLRQQATNQYYSALSLPASRGDIRSSDGASLALSIPSYLVYAKPKEITSKDQFAAEVAPMLSLDEKKLLSDISAPGRAWVPLSRKVTAEMVTTLGELHLVGLGYEPLTTRYYPEASMAAHLLGFVASDQYGNDKGYFGLEGYYDRELRGKDGYVEIERDVQGAPIPIGEAKRVEAQSGRTLTLWLDRSIQRFAENRLAAGIQKYGAKEGSVVIMDPKTGGILAMASFPSYDPLRYETFDKAFYKNPIVAGSYEPGSTFKVLVMAGALNEHTITPQTRMDESGPVQVGEYSVRTWDNKYHGSLTMSEIIQHSSNVGMVFVGKTLGKDRLLRYVRSYGLGKLTNIDLEDETSPELRADRDWGEIDLATTSFGQGIAVTPLQMVRAVSALANDGWLLEPHMVQSISDGKGKVVEVKPKRILQVVSKEAAHTMTEMMINAVDNGEAKWAKPKGYRIAGKTGTAQIPVAGHYDDKKTIASFVGFAPADNPLFVMLVTLREPSSSPWGSETAAPLFFNIAQDIFRYKGVTPAP